MKLKTCAKCHTRMTIDNFQSNGSKGMHPYCKLCKNTQRAAWILANPERHLMYSRRAHANRAGLEFSITKEDVVIPERCPIFGVKMQLNGDRNTSPSIDRIDPSQGYIPGNVAVISYRANRIKNDATKEELLAIVGWLNKL